MTQLVVLVAMGLIFGLPHLLIPRLLGPDQQYTPFAVAGVSALTYDKTVTYAALTNYTALRNAPPYDTDVFENRQVPTATSTVPYFGLAALDDAVGGLDRAFIFCDFVLPPIACFLLYMLLLGFTGNRAVALVGAVVTMLVPFGPRNLLDVPLALARGSTAAIIQPLEYSRSLHPEVSFTLLLAAWLCLWRTFRGGRWVSAILAGVCGGLLFYTYFYYWPVWIGACALLLVATYRQRQARLNMWLANLATWVVGIPFWVTYLTGRNSTTFGALIERHVSERGHVPPPEKLLYTGIYSAIFSLMAYAFYKSRGATDVLVFLTAIFVTSVAALNMEVLTGFNLESMLHFPNRLFQPFFSIAAFGLLVPALGGYASRWIPRLRALGYVSIAAFVSIAVARQIITSVNVADKHALSPEHSLLFNWLNANTRLDDVVVASGKDVNELIPVFTHNLPFVPYGERTSASNQETERRFLVGMKVLGTDESVVRNLLAQDSDHADPPLGLTYTYFLFIGGSGIVNRRLPDAAVESAVSQFRTLDLDRELGQQRVDYLYARGSERPAQLDGWSFTQVYPTGYGSIWHIQRVAA